ARRPLPERATRTRVPPRSRGGRRDARLTRGARARGQVSSLSRLLARARLSTLRFSDPSADRARTHTPAARPSSLRSRTARRVLRSEPDASPLRPHRRLYAGRVRADVLTSDQKHPTPVGFRLRGSSSGRAVSCAGPQPSFYDREKEREDALWVPFEEVVA